jgi:Tol biopolymer transport system component
MKNSILVLPLLCLVACFQKKSEQRATAQIPYPSPRPDTVALVFLPDLICKKDTLEFNSAFSPDGKFFYFAKSNNKQWDIYLSKYDGTNWTNPVLAPFSEPKYSEADPAFAPNGDLYFISNRPKKPTDTLSDFDIWFIKPLANGAWSAPENAKLVNSDSTEYYVSFAKNGNLYFGSNRKGGFGDIDVYLSRFENGQYQTSENLGATINSDKSDHDPCIISEDETQLVFKSEERKDGLGEADLYASKRDKNGKWSQAVNLGRCVNTPAYEYCSYITPDFKYFFFSSELDIKWIDAAFLRQHIDRICK